MTNLREELMDEVDDAWAEPVRHLPLSSGVQDQTRDAAEFIAVVRTGGRDGERPAFRGGTTRVSLMASGGQLRINRTAYPDLQVRKGDKIVAQDRSGQPVFEILSVDDRSHLRLICDLGDA